MNFRRHCLLPLSCFLLGHGLALAANLAPAVPPASLKESYDVVIAGAGTGGCGAAIQAARLGASVLLLEETDWIGGQMNAAAVTSMDEGGLLVRSRGIYHELAQRIEAHYAPLGINPETAYWFSHICVEPRVGRELLHSMLKEAGAKTTLDLCLRTRVTRVLKDGNRVTAVEIETSGPNAGKRTIHSQVLIDATEWGDVLPLTGAGYRVGNHTNADVDPKSRVQSNTWTAVVKQYPKGVPPELLIQAPPPGYDKAAPTFRATLTTGDKIDKKARPQSWTTFIGYRGMPDSSRAGDAPPITRTHLNFNNDFPSTAAEIENPKVRRATDRAMRLRTLQLIYYFQNELGIKDWSVANDEGYDSPYNRAEIDAWIADQPEIAPYRQVLYHFPVIPYVRESRRLIGVHTLTAREIDRTTGHHPIQFATGVALGDYRLDLHGARAPKDLELNLDRAEDGDTVAKEGGAGPFSIPFECFIPEKLDGFLPAEKNISQTRLVNGASRMQPHTMLMGQAAGAIAALSIRHGVQPRDLDPVLVQHILLGASDTLNLTPLKDVAQAAPDWPAIQLVTVHGLMTLKDGRFQPDQPLTADDLSLILKSLNAAGQAKQPVTRAAFAAAVQAPMHTARVNLSFEAAKGEGGQPITRSEAAQVLADFLEQGALARMKGQPQSVAWHSIRPASKAGVGDLTALLRPDLQKLTQRGIITAPDYWAQHAVEGEVCDGAKVAELLTRAARAFDPKATPETAIQVLAREEIIGTPDYWVKAAVPGRTCVGKNVATVIRNLSRRGAFMRRE